jgi:hypothetical protein
MLERVQSRLLPDEVVMVGAFARSNRCQYFERTYNMLKIKCQNGHIFVTDQAIRVETSLGGRRSQKSLSRAMLTGVEMRVYPKILWMGGIHSDIIFYGQGSERIIAKIVKTSEAQQVIAMLGY